MEFENRESDRIVCGHSKMWTLSIFVMVHTSFEDNWGCGNNEKLRPRAGRCGLLGILKCKISAHPHFYKVFNFHKKTDQIP